MRSERKRCRRLVLACAGAWVSMGWGVHARGQDFWWGGAGGAEWSASSFFTAQDGSTPWGVLPTTTNTVVFSTTGATNLATTLSSSVSVLGVRTASDFSLSASISSGSGAGLTVGAGGVQVAGTGPLTISTELLTTASSYALNTALAGSTLTLSGSLATGGAGLSKSGSGRVVLTANNAFAGNVSVTGGTLQLGAGGTTGWVGTANTITNSGTVVFNRSDSVTYTGQISGTSGTVVQSGTGSLMFGGTGVSVGTGLLWVQQGRMQIGDGVNGLGLSAGEYRTDAELAFAPSGTRAINQTISGTGSLTMMGPGTLTLGATNTFSGGLRVTGGTLAFAAAGKLATGLNLTVAQGTFDLRSTQQTPGDLTFGDAALTGTRRIINTTGGAGTLTLSGTIALVGTAAANHAGATLEVPLALTAAGGTTQITASVGAVSGGYDLILSGPVSGTAGLRLNSSLGAGTVVALNASNANAGITRIDSGTLAAVTAGALPSTTVVQLNSSSARLTLATPAGYTGVAVGSYSQTIASLTGVSGSSIDLGTATLTVNQTGFSTYSGDFAATSGSLVKQGSGTLTLAGTNAFTGTLTISGGGVTVASTGTLSAANVVNNASLTLSQSSTRTYVGGISGSGGLTVSGAGPLVLTANHSFGGPTSIVGGVLQIGNGGTSGSLGSNVVLSSGSLIFDRGGSSTYFSTISGNGTVEKRGTGTLAFTGNHTYFGNTLVTGGTLTLQGGFGSTGPVTGNISVASGAVVEFQPFSDVTYSSAVFGAGAVRKSGGWTLSIASDQFHTGVTTITGGRLRLGSGSFLSGGGPSGNLVGDVSVGSGTVLEFFRSNSTGYQGVISGSGTLEFTGAGSVTLTANSTGFTGPTTVTNGTLRLGNGGTTGMVGGTVALGTASGLTIDRSDSFVLTLPVSGSGRFTKAGTGTLTLPGAVGWAGSVTVDAGSIVAPVTDALPTSSPLTVNGGVFLPGGAGQTVPSLSGAGGAVRMSGTMALTVDQSSNTTWGGTLQDGTFFGPSTDTARLVKNGTGTLTLTAGDHKLGGGYTVNAGTLQLGNGGTVGMVSGPVTVAASGRLALNRAGEATFAGPITGAGTVEKLGSGRVTFTTNQAYTGPTIVTNGTLRLGDGGTAGMVAGNVTVGTTGTLAFERSDNVSFGGTITGSGTVLKAGTGTLTYTGNYSSYFGDTEVTSGTLRIGNGGTVGSLRGDAVVSAGASLVFDRSDTAVYGSSISGAGSVTKAGTGTLFFDANHTYSGTTFVTAGELRIDIAGMIAGNTVVSPGAKLVFQRPTDATYPGAVSGSGDVWHLGVSTLTFTGDSTHTGPTFLNPTSTLRIGNGGNTGSITGDINVNSSRLIVDRAGTWTYGGTVSNAGTVVKTGSGRWILTQNGGGLGNLRIEQGTVQLGDGVTNGGTNGYIGFVSVVNNAELALNLGNALFTSAAFPGSGVVTVLGGVSEFGGQQLHTGGTRVRGGTIAFSGSGRLPTGGDLTVSAGGVVLLGTNSHTIGNLVLGDTTLVGQRVLGSDPGVSLTVNGGVTYVAVAGGADGPVTVVGTRLVLPGGNTLFTTSNTTGGSHGLVLSGTVTGSGGLTLGSPGSYPTFRLFLPASSTYAGTTVIERGWLMAELPGSLPSGTAVSLTSSDALLSTSSAPGQNRLVGSLSGVAGATVVVNSGSTLTLNQSVDTTYAGDFSFFTGTGSMAGTLVKQGTGTITLSGSLALLTGMTVSAGAVRFGTGAALPAAVTNNTSVVFAPADSVVYGGVISGSGAVTMAGAGTLAFAANHSYSGNTLVSGGTLLLGNGGTTGGVAGSIVNNATLGFNRTDSFTVANAITGTGTLIKYGPGTMTFNAPLAMTGTVSVNGGVVAATVASFLPASTHLVTEGGFLALGGGSQTLGAVSGSGGGVGNAGSGVLTVNQAINTVWGGFVYDNNYFGPAPDTTRLVKNGVGRLALTSNENIVGGGYTVNAGTLAVGNGGSSGAIVGSVTVGASGTLSFDRSNNLTYSAVVIGAGTVAQSGSGTTTFTGNHAYTGPTRVDAGTLRLGNGGTNGSVIGDMTVAAGAQLTFARSNTLVVAGLIDGPGTVVQSGTGTTTFTGGNTNTGPTLVNNGTLQLGNGGSTGRIQGDAVIASGALLVINRTANLTYSGVMSGAGGVSQVGTATTTFTGAQSFTGLTRVTGGVLRVGNGGTTGSLVADVSVSAGGSLVFARSDASTYPGQLSGTGTVVHTGSGTTTFSANSSITGPLLINAGTVRWGDGGPDGRLQGDITVAAAGALVLNRSSNMTIADVISGAGTLIHATSAQTTLTGANAHTGPTRINAGTLRVGNGGTAGSVSNQVTVAADGSLVFNRSDAVTYAGVVAGSGVLGKTSGGTVSLTGGRALGISLSVSSGAMRVLSAGAALPSGITDTVRGPVTVGAGARFDVATRIEGASLSLNGTVGSTAVAAIGPTGHVTDTVSVLAGLSIANDAAPLGSRSYLGRLSSDQRVVIAGGSLTDVQDMARAFIETSGTRGFGGAATDLSNPLVPVPVPFTQMGILANVDNGVPRFARFGDPVSGPVVAVNDVLAMPTWTGDANLDGMLDARDLNAVLNGWSNGLTGWVNGDNNYDGVINGTDFNRFLAAYGYYQTSGFPLGAGGPDTGSIPEPAAMGLLAPAGFMLARRRRR